MSKEKKRTNQEEPTNPEQETEPAGPESIQEQEAGAQSAETVKPEEKVSSEIEEVKQKLAETESRNKELEDRLLRLAAEFDNYKKRTAREFESIIKNANQNLILDLIDILDNFWRAIEAVQDKHDLEGFKAGVELIHNQMKDLLGKEGLEEIKAKGERFDPALHAAVLQMESEQEEGTILEEISKGYRLNGKVIRHTQVVVAKNKTEVHENSGQENQLNQEGKGE